MMRRKLRQILLSLWVGVLAGLSATIFLSALEWATHAHSTYPQLLFALPVAGALIGWMYQRYGKSVARGNALILDEIHEPKRLIPLRMAPLIFVSTLLTHLFGGSAGREGTAVQMAGALAEQVNRRFRAAPDERRALLAAGMGAGFGAAIGAPLAGVVFGLELIAIRSFRAFAWLECLIASLVGFGVTKVFRAPHSVFPAVAIESYDITTALYVAVAGIAFGLAARFFMTSTHLLESAINRFIPSPVFKPFFGGLALVGLFWLEGSGRFNGLGIAFIQDAFQQNSTWTEPVLKSLFTTLTLASGFKGGEFIPLVFIGATLGSLLALLIPASLQLLSAVGFAAVFGAAARTPLACAIMAAELFGYRIILYALLGCFVASWFAGPLMLYKRELDPTQPDSAK